MSPTDEEELAALLRWASTCRHMILATYRSMDTEPSPYELSELVADAVAPRPADPSRG